jgi:hypothetical protein
LTDTRASQDGTRPRSVWPVWSRGPENSQPGLFHPACKRRKAKIGLKSYRPGGAPRREDRRIRVSSQRLARATTDCAIAWLLAPEKIGTSILAQRSAGNAEPVSPLYRGCPFAACGIGVGARRWSIRKLSPETVVRQSAKQQRIVLFERRRCCRFRSRLGLQERALSRSSRGRMDRRTRRCRDQGAKSGGANHGLAPPGRARKIHPVFPARKHELMEADRSRFACRRERFARGGE